MSRYSHATEREVRRASIVAAADCNDLDIWTVLTEHRDAL
jgi:hypothetical protein